MNIHRIIETLKKDEGFSARAYWDKDQWTYGYGTKAPGKGATITRQHAQIALHARVEIAIAEFREIFDGLKIDEVRAEALVNMLFNLGKTKFLHFRKMVAAVRERDWGHVAAEAHNSRWFKQLSKPGLKSIERAERIVWELLTGSPG